MPDSGANNAAFYDMRFFDPATFYNKSVITTGAHGSAPALCTFGTVHFALKGDRGERVSITLPDTMYNPRMTCNIVAPARLHEYGLATVVSLGQGQSGLWYDVNTPTARKFATFSLVRNRPFLRPCAVGVSPHARRLAWLSNLYVKVPYAWAVFRPLAAACVFGRLLLWTVQGFFDHRKTHPPTGVPRS